MFPAYLTDIIILLTAAVIFVPLMQYLRLGPILGFLVAGAMIGPWVLGLITEVDEIRHFAELGVAFLLFIIGVELKPKRLLLMRRWVFGLGSVQVLFTGLVLVGITMLLGLSVNQAIIVGFGLALSSTAFVLQLLTDMGQLGTLPGKRSFAILLLQDLAVVPLLALVPLLTENDINLGMDLAVAFGEAALILILIIVGGRLFLRPILHQIARTGNPDIFAATAVLLVLGVAALITQAGFSMAMGAFVAGLLIADSEYRHQVLADIQPFRSFLLGLFFMSVGMSMDFGVLLDSPEFLALALLGLVLIKGIIVWLAARMFGIQARQATSIALMLAQSGEFAFVIFGLALTEGVIEKILFDQLILIVAMSMAITPALAAMARRYFSPVEGEPESHLKTTPNGMNPLVILVGFGRVGRRVAQMLESFDIPYIAVDTNAELVNEYRIKGFPVFFGNAEKSDVLTAAGVKLSRLVLITIDRHGTTEHMIAELRRQSPTLHIVARCKDSAHCKVLREAGADETISEAFESSLQLGADALDRLGFPLDKIFWLKQKMRVERSNTHNDISEP